MRCQQVLSGAANNGNNTVARCSFNGVGYTVSGLRSLLESIVGRGYQICPINGKIDYAPTIFIVPGPGCPRIYVVCLFYLFYYYKHHSYSLVQVYCTGCDIVVLDDVFHRVQLITNISGCRSQITAITLCPSSGRVSHVFKSVMSYTVYSFY